MAWVASGYATGMAPPPASWAPTAWGSGPTQGGPGGLGYNPQVPLPTTTAPGAVAGNLGSLGAIYGVAGGVNQFQQGQAALGLQTNLPGYQGLTAQSSQNIGQELKGEVPSDVVNQILQGAAERGIVTGSPGSPNANAAYLRALGLTSLGMQQQGEQNLTAAIGRTPQAAPMNLSPFLVTPAQQQEAEVANRLYGAAPNPTAVAGANLGAAYGGLAAGRGSVGSSPIMMPTGFESYGGSLPTTGATGTNIGGVTYEPGQNPNTAFSNWNDWYSSIFPQTGGTASTSGDQSYYDALLGAGPDYGATGGGDQLPQTDEEMMSYFGF